jgi:hypothetical protein
MHLPPAAPIDAVLAPALGSIDALKSSSSNRATGDAIAPTAALHNALHKPTAAAV